MTSEVLPAPIVSWKRATILPRSRPKPARSGRPCPRRFADTCECFASLLNDFGAVRGSAGAVLDDVNRTARLALDRSDQLGDLARRALRFLGEPADLVRNDREPAARSPARAASIAALSARVSRRSGTRWGRLARSDNGEESAAPGAKAAGRPGLPAPAGSHPSGCTRPTLSPDAVLNVGRTRGTRAAPIRRRTHFLTTTRLCATASRCCRRHRRLAAPRAGCRQRLVRLGRVRCSAPWSNESVL